MRISLMREFIVLSENLNFTKTAQQLYITQSVLSKHIAIIEQQLGAPLFIRDRQSVRLTEIGKLFLTEAVDIVKRYDEGIERINVALNKAPKELKIGYLDAHMRNILVPLVQRFEKKFPDVSLTLISNEYDSLLQQLRLEELDVIFTLKFDGELSSFCNIYKIERDFLCAVARYDHPLAKMDNISLKALSTERIILPNAERFIDFAAYVDNIFEKAGLLKSTTARYPHVNSALLMVEAGKGVSMLPGKLAFNANENICFIPIDGKSHTFDVIAAWRKKNKNPSIEHLIEMLDPEYE